MKKSYTTRDAVLHLYKDRIDAQATKKANGAKKGSPEWLGKFPGAVSYVTQKLLKEEIKELEDLVNHWNLHGAPDEVKAA
jgi:hypothetical protein